MRERVNPLTEEDNLPTAHNFIMSEEEIFLALKNNTNPEIKYFIILFPKLIHFQDGAH